MAVPDGETIKDGEQSIELQEDQWAIIRNPRMVSEKRRRALLASATGSAAVREELTAIVAANKAQDALPEDQRDPQLVPQPTSAVMDNITHTVDLLILALVRAWSYGPVNEGILLDLPAPDYDVLEAITAPLYNAVMPNFNPDAAMIKSEDGSLELDHESPTPPSAE